MALCVQFMLCDDHYKKKVQFQTNNRNKKYENIESKIVIYSA